METKPLQAIGIDVADGKAVRGAFDAAWDAADKAETLQRLDGLTKALPVAAITPQTDDRERWLADRRALMDKIKRQRRELRNMNRSLRSEVAARWAAVGEANRVYKALHAAHVAAVRRATPMQIIRDWYHYRSGQMHPCAGGWRYLAWTNRWRVRWNRAMLKRRQRCEVETTP